MSPVNQPVIRPMWTLAGPALGAMLAAYQFAVLIGLSNVVARDLHTAAITMVIIIAAHLIAMTAGFVPGLLLGRKLPEAVVGPSLVLMLLGGFVAALAPSGLVWTIVGLFTGLGWGAIAGTATGLAGQMGERSGTARTIFAVAGVIGLAFGLILSWVISHALSWRLVYWLAVPMLLVAILVTAASGVFTLVRNQNLASGYR